MKTQDKVDITRTRVSAVVLKDKNILLVKGNSGFYKDFYFTPGGKIEKGETKIQTLNRELMEELSIKPNGTKKYIEYVAKNWDGNYQKVICYLVNLSVNEIKLSGEIEKMIWYSRNNFNKNEIKISESMAEFLIPKLINDKLL